MLKLMNILALDKQKKLKKQDAMGTSDITNYLLHHSVLNVNKLGKDWAVLYVSAKHQYTWLNDSLLLGPDLLNNPVLVLVKLRHGKYVVIADKKSMFLEINMKRLDI